MRNRAKEAKTKTVFASLLFFLPAEKPTGHKTVRVVVAVAVVVVVLL